MMLSLPLLLALVAQPTPVSDRGRLLTSAAAELSAGRRVEAARLFRAAADQFGSVRALMQLARLQSGDGDVKGALDSLRKARAIAPNSEEVLSAFAQLSLAARTPVPAILTLDPLTRMAPTVPQYHYLLGVALLQAGDAVAATEALQQAERLEPERPLALIALGLALNTRKLHAEARTFLTRALELDPENVEAVAALSEAEEGLGELPAAESHASRALAAASGNATANLVIGLVRMKQERYGEARDALLRAIALEPGSPKAHYQLSLVYARLGDEAESRKYLALYERRLREREEQIQEIRGRSRGQR